MFIWDFFFDNKDNYAVSSQTGAIFGLIFILISITCAILFSIFKNDLQQNEKFKKTFKISFTIIGISYLVYDPLYSIIRSTLYDGTDSVIRVLPLHICSFSTICYLLYLNNPKFKYLHKSTIYISIVGALFALLVVTANVKPVHFRYYSYFIGHSAIIIAYAYYFTVEQSHPSWKDTMYGSIAFLILEFCILLPFNLVFDTLYGYIGPYATRKISLLSTLFGEWPNMLWKYGLAMVLALSITVLITYLLGKYPIKSKSTT